jgi:anti-anti-sigma factor
LSRLAVARSAACSYTAAGFKGAARRFLAARFGRAKLSGATGRTVHGTDHPELPAERRFTVQAPGLAVVTNSFPAGSELILIGELDQATRPIFDSAVGQALRLGPPILLLDLAELEFLAVAGARGFAESHQRCELLGGRLVLVNPVRSVRRLLELFDIAGLVLER